jgi:YD repeat-containing protein
VDVGPDGTIYIADDTQVRRVTPDGYIATVAGKPGPGSCAGDGVPATSVGIAAADVAVAPDGSLYVAGAGCHTVRRIDPDGTIHRAAGTGGAGYFGDGGLAIDAGVRYPDGIAVGGDGSFFIGEWDSGVVRRVGVDGIITTFAGSWPTALETTGDNGPATAASLALVTGARIALTPDGRLLVMEWNRIREVRPALPDGSEGINAIASEDGSEVYLFDDAGRHLSTVDALTGATRYEFAYDSEGRLTTVTDGDGNVTTIQHDGNGNPTAIVGPYGQRTGSRFGS